MTPNEKREYERKRNLEKQRRFLKKHPQYHGDRSKLKRMRSFNVCTHGQFRTYELADPRDNKLKMVGYCLAATIPVWAVLWQIKGQSEYGWAAWLCELDSLGLQPVELFGWALGRYVPLNKNTVIQLVEDRLNEIKPTYAVHANGEPIKHGNH